MNKWSELTDFSEFEGTTPCVLCKADSSKTILGGHWKCSVCAHVFNQDGSEMTIKCHCETCQEKNKEPMIDIAEALKQLKELEKQQKPKKSKKKTK